MRKRVDERLRSLLRRTWETHTRALLFLIGDHAKDQVPNLHYMMCKVGARAKPSVLWMYKRELGFSSHRKKRMRQIRKMVQRGMLDPDQEDPFEVFISSTSIRFAYYAESEKILGNTYGMLVLQDFEALTPNLLARTIETVEGGGLVVVLLSTLTSLRQLYTLSMDLHVRYQTERYREVVPRFNERLVRSLASCPAVLIMDDELNVLPVVGGEAAPTHGQALGSAVPTALPTADVGVKETDAVLRARQTALREQYPLGALLQCAKTLDQAETLIALNEALLHRSTTEASGADAPASRPSRLAGTSITFVTAARGRGKSASLGLATALAIVHGYSNVAVAAPSPENLVAFFAFAVSGLKAVGYQEHLDFQVDADRHKHAVRIGVWKTHRQSVQYLEPTVAAAPEADTRALLASAELLIVDEAAAIPLLYTNKLVSSAPAVSCNVFLSSTVTGYEGTGRSLSLKLLQQLRASARPAAAGTNGGSGRRLRELQLRQPIRYAERDPIETWLYRVLCLEATAAEPLASRSAPHPRDCQLFEVDRDALFSAHAMAEAFLHRVMALFVSSHYKNSPNDLQMLSDAPAHRLYVLLAPDVTDDGDDDESAHRMRLPDVLCALQVCLEGAIGHERVAEQLGRGKRAAGDLIPWTVSQQFQEPAFAGLTGARIVRIATHPDVQGMGYGTRAVQLLLHHVSADAQSALSPSSRADVAPAETDTDVLPQPLLHRLDERPRELLLDYLGVSFGLAHGLFRFWRRLGFLPVYVRLTPNELTAEHTCILLHDLRSDAASAGVGGAPGGIRSLYEDWRRRFLSLLGYQLRDLPVGLALAMLEMTSASSSVPLTYQELQWHCSPHDRQRLASYARDLLDYHVVLDMVPLLARLYFLRRFDAEAVSLSAAQQAILLALGLQHRSLESLDRELDVGVPQLLALFSKVMRKMAAALIRIEEAALARDMPAEPDTRPVGDGERSAAADLQADLLGEEGEDERERRGSDGVPRFVSKVTQSKGVAGETTRVPNMVSMPAAAKPRDERVREKSKRRRRSADGKA